MSARSEGFRFVPTIRFDLTMCTMGYPLTSTSLDSTAIEVTSNTGGLESLDVGDRRLLEVAGDERVFASSFSVSKSLEKSPALSREIA